MTTDTISLKLIIESALLAAGEPVTVDRLQHLFGEDACPETAEIRQAIKELNEDYQDRSLIIKEVASGFCLEVKPEFGQWIVKLWEERPPRYSRAFLETLSIIAYRQPITRGEIEEIRGVAVSSTIIKTLMDREWVRSVGYREVPGKPELLATTKQFLDHFNLKSLEQLPSLVALQNIDDIVIPENTEKTEEAHAE